MPNVTQKTLILKHLQDNGTITSMEAINCYGATRLAAVIYILKTEGYNIDTNIIVGKNRYGRPVTYAEYMLLP